MKIDEAANHKQGSHITDERVSGWVPAFSIMGLDHNDVVCVWGGEIAGLLQRSWLILSVCKLPLADKKRDFI